MSVSRELRYVSRSVLIRSCRRDATSGALTQTRTLHDGRNRLSNFWTPTTRLTDAEAGDATPSNQTLLAKAGFLRQSHSGIFHLLPLGLRVQDKLERLIDKHMTSIGASKVSLSSLSSEELWAKSGRLEGRDSEFFRLVDRRGSKYLLSPTHEEEITMIVGNAVSSHKDLPLRLYQISRKYRDEARPREGLLRGREFLMKDLYTFDLTEAQAKATYEEVRKAYSAFLDELGLPYVVADADSGKMGGNLSHEYHFISASGEDNIVACKNCGHAVNEELLVDTPPTAQPDEQSALSKGVHESVCPKCSSNNLTISQAVEIGHTFHLSTRYSAPLAANVLGPDNKLTTMQMGCHGIGVSRLIAAASGILTDERGLNWPYAVAPFQAVMVAAPSITSEDVSQVYDGLREALPDLDLVLDDRQRQLGWKLNDADLIGYPFIVLLGRKWASERRVELQCRRLNIKEDVSFFMLPEYLKDLAAKL